MQTSLIRLRFLSPPAVCLAFFVSVSAYAARTKAVSSRANDWKLENRLKLKKGSEQFIQELQRPTNYDAVRANYLAKKRALLIDQIRLVLKKTKDSTEKGELWLRLASLHLEDYYKQLGDSQISYQKKLQEGNGKKLPEGPDLSAALVPLRKARNIFSNLLILYPDHPQRDEILYQVGLAFFDEGKFERGIRDFDAVVRDFPKSKHIDEVLMLSGDYYFDNAQYSLAEGRYDAVISHASQSFASYALYRKAWCRYNRSDPKGAVALFKNLLALNPKEQSESALKIRDEAIRDIAYPFADLKMIDEAESFYRSLGSKFNRQGLESMAVLLDAHGENAKAIGIWKTLESLDPTYFGNAGYELRIIQALGTEKVNDQVDRLIGESPKYLDTGSAWRKKNSGKDPLVKDVLAQWENTLRVIAINFHGEAQRSREKDRYVLARRLYLAYLKWFPRGASVSNVRFNLAEILYKNHSYSEAADEYYRGYQADPSNGSRDKILYSGILALNELINEDRKRLGLSPVGSDSEEKMSTKSGASIEPYSASEKKFLEMSREYLTVFPKSKEAMHLAYRFAYLQYVHRDWQESQKSFERYLAAYSDRAGSERAAGLVLDILNRQADLSNLVSFAQRLLKNPRFLHGVFHSEVAKVLHQAELKRVQSLETKGDYEAAARGYLHYASVYGKEDSALLEKALFNASADFLKAKKIKEAREAQESFVLRFPRSELRRNLLLELAKANEASAQFGKAAEYYAQFAKSFPDETEAPQALRLAALYYWANGHGGLAEKSMRNYLALYTEQATQVETDLLELYESQGKFGKALAQLQEGQSERKLSATADILLRLRIIDYSVRLKGRLPKAELEEALEKANRFAGQLKRSAAGAEALSKLRFWNLQTLDSEFHQSHVVGRDAMQAKSLQKKLSLLKKLEAEYEKIAKLGGEWGLAAIYKTAVAYRRLAEEVDHAQVPRGLAASSVSQYQEDVRRTLVKPFNTKARALAQQCLSKTGELSLLSPWGSRCHALLVDIAPTDYLPVRTFYLPATQLAILYPEDEPLEGTDADSYLYFSTLLFRASPESSKPRRFDSLASVLWSETRSDYTDTQSTLPRMVSYESLAEPRRQRVIQLLNEEKAESTGSPSFTELNLIRLESPARAIPLIRASLEESPGDLPLLNLLGVALLESGDRTAAKVTWLSVIASGHANPVVSNNLAAVAILEGREARAELLYGEAAHEARTPVEVFENLGALALKHHNGKLAQTHFASAKRIKARLPSQTGIAEGLLQEGLLDEGGKQLVGLAAKYKEDPFVSLSATYYMVDVQKDPNWARQIASDYLTKHPDAPGFPIRQALEDAKRVKETDMEMAPASEASAQ